MLDGVVYATYGVCMGCKMLKYQKVQTHRHAGENLAPGGMVGWYVVCSVGG